MRWVLLNDEYPPALGGVGQVMAGVARALREAGDQVVVVARRRPGLPAEVVAGRGPSYRRWGGLWGSLAALPALRRADGVIAASWEVAAPAAPVLKALGCPVLVLGHGSELSAGLGRGRAVLAGARGRFVMSGYLQRCLLAEGLESVVLPAPVWPLAAPAPARAELGRLLFVGRLVPRKGLVEAVRLAAELGCVLEVVGEGPGAAGLVAAGRALGVQVLMRGPQGRAGVAAALVRCDALVLLSSPAGGGLGEEGLGLAVLEAAACGRPAIVSETGGLPEAAGPAGLVLRRELGAEAVRAWYSAERGAQAWARLVQAEGPARGAGLLRSAI